jgi:hypothetical protein
MNQWFKIVVISVFCILFSSCTNSKHTQAHAEQASSQASRGIASVSKKRSKVKLRKYVLKRKGFYIDHASLQPLSFKDQARYYGIFGKAMQDYEKMIRKNKKSFSYNETSFEKIKAMFLPKADAVACPSAGWVLDNGQSSCTKANWFFRPETLASFSSYKPADSLWNSSLDNCKSNGNRMVCPAVGLVVREGKALLACTSDDKGLSASCSSEFEKGGLDTTVRLLNECETGATRSVDNVTCDDLKSSVQKAIKMFNDNCTATSMKSNDTLDTICNRLQTAVDGVAKKVGEAVNPITATEMPNVPTCNMLADGVESKNSPVAASDTWNSLLDIARNNCSDLNGKDRNSAALIFGKCQKRMPTPKGVDLTELVSQYGDAKKRASGGEADGYVKRFAETFGLTPSRYENLFCGAGNITNFTRRITDDLDGYIKQSEDDLLKILRFSDLKGAKGINEPQFNQLKQWMNDNSVRIVNLGRSLSSTAIDQAESLVTPSDRASAKVRVDQAMAAAKNKSDFSLEQFFSEGVLKNKTELEQLKIRTALASEIKSRIMSPGHQNQIKASADFLRSCAAEVRKDGEARRAEGGTFTPDENNFKGCRYVQETDMTGYFANDKNKPYVIFQKGEPGKCYEQSGAAREEETTIGGNTVTIRRIDAKNPTSPSDILSNLTMNNSTFDVGTSDTSSKPYKLFRYSCTRDIADVESPFKPAGEGSVW